MNTHKFFTGRIVGFIVFLVVLFIGLGFYVFNNYVYKEKQGDVLNFEPYSGVLTGVQECLVPKDTVDVNISDCPLAIQTDTGEYYALDFSLMSEGQVEIKNGDRFSASGIITPIERLSTDQWQKYDLQGIFSVTDSVQIGKNQFLKDPVFTWQFKESDSLNLDGNPATDIFLEIKYADGESLNPLIATVPGGCNTREDKENDSVVNSENIQCYYAGLGSYYKIRKGETLYLVERRIFEEAMPDFTPPAYEYETVYEFPL